MNGYFHPLSTASSHFHDLILLSNYFNSVIIEGVTPGEEEMYLHLNGGVDV